jgi:organic radical activating enzyme
MLKRKLQVSQSAEIVLDGEVRRDDAPLVPLVALDSLWFQVAGTVCNLRCAHCFISCAPENHSYWFLDLETIKSYLDESRGWGVKEYYFTGGEPFMNKDLLPMLEATLAIGPASVLTNATLLFAAWPRSSAPPATRWKSASASTGRPPRPTTRSAAREPSREPWKA